MTIQRDKKKKAIYDKIYRTVNEKRIKARKKVEYIENRKYVINKSHRYYIKNRNIININRKGYLRYIKALFGGIGNRLRNCKSYKFRKLLFILNEFENYILNNNNYKKLHKEWVKNNYIHRLAPTVDRINNKGHYSLDNIQIITKSENAKKYVN